LAPIRTGLDLIRLAGDSPESVRRVRIIMERQVGQMVRLIDDLLDVARITSGKIVLQRAPTSLTELVQTAVIAGSDERMISAGRRVTG
jgi:signal transduction histidine kinase